jgi:SAM-dependent methyltransferase
MSAFFKAKPDTLAFGIVPAFRKYELYQVRYLDLAPVVRREHDRLGRTLDVLDVGAGRGEAKLFCDAAVPDARWTAVEPHPERSAECTARGYQRLITDIDLEQNALPLDDASYDVVIASHVLEHLENAPQALADWMRVVRPGGSLLLGVPMHLAPVAALARLKYRLVGRRRRGHCHFFSMGSLRRFLAPYQVERIWGFRLLSARRQLPLEDWEWFYRASAWLGAKAPSLTAEVNVQLVKRA